MCVCSNTPFLPFRSIAFFLLTSACIMFTTENTTEQSIPGIRSITAPVSSARPVREGTRIVRLSLMVVKIIPENVEKLKPMTIMDPTDRDTSHRTSD